MRNRILGWPVRLALAAAVPPLLTTSLLGGCDAQDDTARTTESSRTTDQIWIGTRLPPLPAGVTLLEYTSIGDANHARFALEHVVVDGQHLLWLGQFVEDAAEHRTWVVTDVLPIRQLEADERLVLVLCGKLLADAPAQPEPKHIVLDPEIVAIAQLEEGPVLTQLEQAWCANQATKMFEAVPTEGIVCINGIEPHP